MTLPAEVLPLVKSLAIITDFLVREGQTTEQDCIVVYHDGPGDDEFIVTIIKTDGSAVDYDFSLTASFSGGCWALTLHHERASEHGAIGAIAEQLDERVQDVFDEDIEKFLKETLQTSYGYNPLTVIRV